MYVHITATYKYKAYALNRNRTAKVRRLMDAACGIYNHVVALQRRYYALYGGYVGLYRMQSHMAKMRGKNKEWMIVGSQSVQQICERVNFGYAKFFRKENRRPPQFRSRKRFRSLTYKDTGWKLNGNELVINSLSLRIPFHLSRPIEGRIQRVCIKRDALGDLWIIVTARTEVNGAEQYAKTGETAGMDFGIRTFLTLHDGTTVQARQPLLDALSELKSRQQTLSRRVKGSGGKAKARADVARMHRKVADQRSEMHWKTADDLVRRYDVICVEDLDIADMLASKDLKTRKAAKAFRRKLLDIGWSDFLSVLEHKCVKHGKKLVKMDRWYASSKTCSSCGHVHKELKLSDTRWTCPVCGEIHDRDLNAAKNIHRVGTSSLASGTVRPA